MVKNKFPKEFNCAWRHALDLIRELRRGVTSAPGVSGASTTLSAKSRTANNEIEQHRLAKLSFFRARPMLFGTVRRGWQSI
jgi:hypothetical protein